MLYIYIMQLPLLISVLRSKSNTKLVRTSKRVTHHLASLLSGDDWTDCLRAEKILLPLSPFLGFSAMTGDVFDAHEFVGSGF